MSNLRQDATKAKPTLDSCATKEPFVTLTHKLEPGLNLYCGSSEHIQGANPSWTDQTLTMQAAVKGHLEGEILGEKSDVPDSESSGVMMEDSDSDGERTLSPGPAPTPCNKEILRTKSAIFIKLLNRGEYNSCSRCDLMFKPMLDSKMAKKRDERDKKPVLVSSSPSKEVVKKKTESPRPSSTSNAQVISNVPLSHAHQDRVTPVSYPDTPALRQLSEYAKPHALGQDLRSMPGYYPYPFMDPLRMAVMYPPNSRERLEMEFATHKRERDARERELRGHELRSLEMREKLKTEMELTLPGLERLLPPGATLLDEHWLDFQRRYAPHMLPGGSGTSHIPGIYPPTSLASDLMARERERLERLGIPLGHPMLADSAYTAAIMERLLAEHMSMERVPAERLQAERYAVHNPMVRLQMSGISGASAEAAATAAAAKHAHTHTHAHSHTHLHLHEPDLVPPLAPGGATPHQQLLQPHHVVHQFPPDVLQSDQMTSPMIYQIYTQHLTNEQHVYMQQVSNELIMRAGSMGANGANGGFGNKAEHQGVEPSPSHLVYQFSRADPLSGINGSINQIPPGSLGCLPIGVPPHFLGREQELLQSDLYRRAYTDPAIAQQLQAHHEALQRMAMERERFVSGHLPPPH